MKQMYSGGCLYRRKFQLNSQKSEASDKNASSSFAASLFPFATDFFLVGSGDVSGVFDVFSEFFLDFRVTFLPSIDTFYRVIQVIRMIQLLQIFNSYLEKILTPCTQFKNGDFLTFNRRFWYNWTRRISAKLGATAIDCVNGGVKVEVFRLILTLNWFFRSYCLFPRLLNRFLLELTNRTVGEKIHPARSYSRRRLAGQLPTFSE